ncbi:MAG TPA: molybdopterin cofactor-binding domain-containing protein, partial [Bryobacteraceae bacterium]|nr:molybdopterin cofactor-binding domain-containing protein [Bryobacteraceae bacterium]
METVNTLSRRGLFRVAGGALFVRFALGQSQTKSLDAAQVDSFIAIHADGSVTLYTSKVDVGTGLLTAYRQIAAEELDLPADRITVVQGDTALVPDHGGTGGSTGVQRGGVDIRRAAATARKALLEMAAKQPNGPVSILALAPLIGDRQLNLKIDPNAPLKDPSTYKVVGKSLPRTDVPGKCTGRHTYLQDYSVPDMLHGRVVRAPAIGARLLSVDEASLAGIPDVRIVRIENFLGVVAKDEWAAVKAARALKTSWSEWRGLPGHEALPGFVRQGQVDHDTKVALRGDVDGSLASSPNALASTYYWPFQSHASLGPSCAVADYRETGTTTIWSSTQGVYGLRGNLGRVFGIPVEKLRVIYMDGSGSYGTNGAD